MLTATADGHSGCKYAYFLKPGEGGHGECPDYAKTLETFKSWASSGEPFCWYFIADYVTGQEVAHRDQKCDQLYTGKYVDEQVAMYKGDVLVKPTNIRPRPVAQAVPKSRALPIAIGAVGLAATLALALAVT